MANPFRGRWLPLLFIAGAAALAACAPKLRPAYSAQVVRGTDLETLEVFYLPSHDGDRGIGEDIRSSLEAHGKTTHDAPAPARPEANAAVVSYEDRWMWGFSGMSIALLRVDIRDPSTQVLLASAAAYRLDDDGWSHGDVARHLIDGIFAGGLVPTQAAGREDR